MLFLFLLTVHWLAIPLSGTMLIVAAMSMVMGCLLELINIERVLMYGSGLILLLHLTTSVVAVAPMLLRTSPIK